MRPSRSAPGLLVLAPLRIEARALKRGARGAMVARTGSGPIRAWRAAARLRETSPGGAPAAVSVAGVGGALVPGMTSGTVVVADQLLRDGPGPAVPAEALASAPLLAAALRARGLDVRVGPVVSTGRLVRGQAERMRLAATGALAVDMESADLLTPGWDVPTAVVRVIVDTPERELLSHATATGGLRALRSLRTAAPVLEEWAAAVGARRVLLAAPRSFCAGVERAIETVERAIDRFGPPIYVRRQIVHNRHVVADLEARGAVFVHELDQVPDGAPVVFSAHGVSPEVRAVASERGLRVVDATCPLVAKVHHELRRFAERGFQVVLIGHAGHDETEGTLGEPGDVKLVERQEDIDALTVTDPQRIAYVTQTTLAPADVADLVGSLRTRFPAIVGPHTSDICYATQNRQDAVSAIAADCDLVLVVGSSNSSNTNRLVEVARRAGARAELLDDESELQLAWLAGATSVGVTAGASAPAALVDRVVAALGSLGPLEVEQREIRSEHTSFPLPTEVR